MTLSRLDIITQPTTTPISLQVLKNYIRFYEDVDDNLLQHFLWTATEMAEQYLGRKLFTYQYKWTIAKKHHRHHFLYGNAGWIEYGADWFPYLRHSINLPMTPILNVQSVSYGQWCNPIDTFLVQGTDYYVDLQTDPARVQFINVPAEPWYQDHLSMVFTTGIAETSTVTTTGTATATASASLDVGGVPITVAVTTGDTSQAFTSNLYTAIAAASTPLSATVITPTTLSLRGYPATVSVTASVAGLTITQSAPISAIPIAVKQGILDKAANMYRNMGRQIPDADDRRFYAALDPWRFYTFPSY